MKNKIINIILNCLIIGLIITIMIVIIMNVLEKGKKNFDNIGVGIEELKEDTNAIKLKELNSYDEISIAYHIVNKYLTAYANDDYDLLVSMTKGPVKKQIFEANSRLIVEKEYFIQDVNIVSQKVSEQGVYYIEYTLGDNLNLKMQYFVNKAQYAFIVLEDSLLGEIYE